MRQIGDLVVAALGALVVFINGFGLISVIRNYRRLRQRMYLFVISLTAVNVVVGVAYICDIINKFARHHQVANWIGQPDCGSFSYKQMAAMKGLECASVILSALNTVLLTYALHKRTTRMGRHREESNSIYSSNGEGNSMLQLPAFDTMLRVLSLGQSQNEDKAKKMKIDKENLNNFDSSYNETSLVLDSKVETSFCKEDTTKTHLNGYHRTTKERTKPKSLLQHGRIISKTSTNSVSRSSIILKRGSYFSRSSHSYIGRHSVSVVSMRASIGLLLVVWMSFLVMWVTPIVLRLHQFKINQNDLSLSDYLVCPAECDSEFIVPTTTFRKENLLENGNISNQSPNTPLTSPSPSNIRIRHHKNPRLSAEDEESSPVDNSPISDPDTGVIIDEPSEDSSGQKEEANKAKEVFNQSYAEGAAQISSASVFLLRPRCISCSSYFYPLSKIHVIFNASVIVITWIYMLYCSLRLLWLRKHSNNVFVRCSALWKFILFTATFYIAATSPYVLLCIADVIKHVIFPSSETYANYDWYSSSKSLPSHLMTSTNVSTFTVENITDKISNVDKNQLIIRENKDPFQEFSQPRCLLTSKETMYVTIASCFLLLHSASASLLYLTRLLGFRRLINGL